MEVTQSASHALLFHPSISPGLEQIHPQLPAHTGHFQSFQL